MSTDKPHLFWKYSRWKCEGGPNYNYSYGLGRTVRSAFTSMLENARVPHPPLIVSLRESEWRDLCRERVYRRKRGVRNSV